MKGTYTESQRNIQKKKDNKKHVKLVMLYLDDRLGGVSTGIRVVKKHPASRWTDLK
ncbi:hypothetical protein PGB90_001487 [Kerria lacca]